MGPMIASISPVANEQVDAAHGIHMHRADGERLRYANRFNDTHVGFT